MNHKLHLSSAAELMTPKSGLLSNRNVKISCGIEIAGLAIEPISGFLNNIGLYQFRL